MSFALTLPTKFWRLVLEAVKEKIAASEALHVEIGAENDEAGDFGNDLWILKSIGQEMEQALSAPSTHFKIYQAWRDADGVSLSDLTGIQSQRDNGQLSVDAVLEYELGAATFEEALAIHNLRQGFGPHVPMGEPAQCPQCAAWFYPQGSGQCWRCDHKQ
jgi:hypothetical protein